MSPYNQSRRAFRKAVEKIPDRDIRRLVRSTRFRAYAGNPTWPIGLVWYPPTPVPLSDPPIAEPMLSTMVALLDSGRSVILVANDRQSRDRAAALLDAAMNDEKPFALS